MENKKNQLESRCKELWQELQKARKELEDFNKRENLEKLKSFVGKCYSAKHSIGEHDKKHYSLRYIYGVDEEKGELHALSIGYWEDSDTYYEIEYDSMIYYSLCNQEDQKLTEITKKQFDRHYQEVQKRLQNVISFISNG